jgi:hypothetical protein
MQIGNSNSLPKYILAENKESGQTNLIEVWSVQIESHDIEIDLCQHSSPIFKRIAA